MAGSFVLTACAPADGGDAVAVAGWGVVALIVLVGLAGVAAGWLACDALDQANGRPKGGGR